MHQLRRRQLPRLDRSMINLKTLGNSFQTKSLKHLTLSSGPKFKSFLIIKKELLNKTNSINWSA